MSKQTDEHFLDINGLEILYEKNEFFPLLKFQVFFLCFILNICNKRLG